MTVTTCKHHTLLFMLCTQALCTRSGCILARSACCMLQYALHVESTPLHRPFDGKEQRAAAARSGRWHKMSGAHLLTRVRIGVAALSRMRLHMQATIKVLDTMALIPLPRGSPLVETLPVKHAHGGKAAARAGALDICPPPAEAFERQRQMPAGCPLRRLGRGTTLMLETAPLKSSKAPAVKNASVAPPSEGACLSATQQQTIFSARERRRGSSRPCRAHVAAAQARTRQAWR